MDTLFISDLHLSPERPDKIDLFQRFMRGRARECKALYILGDLFEQFWVGNDDVTPPNPDIIAELLDFSRHNANIYIMRGNRELMLNPVFQDISGCQVLADQSVIDLDGKKVLLSHGDVLCSLDVGYQRYRRFIESGFTQTVFPRLPYRLRILISHGLKPMVKKSSVKKAKTIVDVDQATVEACMHSHGVQDLIHGHTHLPGVHTFSLNDQPATRTVLSDWYESDGVLVCRDGEQTLMGVEEYLGLG